MDAENQADGEAASSEVREPVAFPDGETAAVVRDSEETASCNPESHVAASSQGRRRLLFARFFWIFVICSVVGLLIEEAYHFAVYGEWENREGMLFGPFSPLYGVGAVVLGALGYPLRRVPWPMAFLGFMAAGAVIEYGASCLLEAVFGITSWNYVNAEFTIDGRVNLAYTVAWGLLGLLCTRVVMPIYERYVMPLIERMPRAVSIAAYTLFVVDIVMTLLAFDCWFWRLDGQEPTGPIQTFYAEHFDNEFMEERFETMSIDPEHARR